VASGSHLPAPTAVTGTVSDDHVGISYTVTVVPFDGSPSVQIGRGSTTSASALTLSNITFDPTMLDNGGVKKVAGTFVSAAHVCHYFFSLTRSS
jgi:hypothetical protein